MRKTTRVALRHRLEFRAVIIMGSVIWSVARVVTLVMDRLARKPAFKIERVKSDEARPASISMLSRMPSGGVIRFVER